MALSVKLKKRSNFDEGRPPAGQEKPLTGLRKPIHRLKKRGRAPEPAPIGYRDGGEGMGKWCDEFVYVPIYPEGSDIAVWYPMVEFPDEPNPKTGK